MKQFWLDKWVNNDIPFHKSEITPELDEYWPQLHVAKGARVFVPLCGKSLDMLWLAQQGHHVVGIELSEKGIIEFFTENNIDYQQQGTMFTSDSFTIYCQDIFEFELLQRCDAVFDRAALIALPQKLRQRYVDVIKTCINQDAPIFLKCLEYDQKVMEGPPFSVVEDEVRTLYQNYQQIKCVVRQEDAIEQSNHLFAKGLREVVNTLYFIR